MTSRVNLHRIPTLAGIRALHTALRMVPLHLLALPVHHLRPVHSFVLRLWVQAHLVDCLVHQAAALAEFVDRADGVDGFVQRSTGVEVLLDGRQEILTATNRGFG